MRRKSPDRYVSAGVWLRAQDVLMAVVKVLVAVALIGAPVVGLVSGRLMLGFSVLVGCTLTSLWLVAVSFALEPLRMNGVPVLER